MGEESETTNLQGNGNGRLAKGPQPPTSDAAELLQHSAGCAQSDSREHRQEDRRGGQGTGENLKRTRKTGGRPHSPLRLATQTRQANLHSQKQRQTINPAVIEGAFYSRKSLWTLDCCLKLILPG